jgi:outer membrane protein
MKHSKKLWALACVLAAVSAPAAADKGELGIRARALYMDADSDTSPNINVGVEDRWIPEVDLSYWMTDKLALELVLTYPQKHDVSLNGAAIGSVKHLPPTLMLQYHFMPKQTFQPYVGIGVNYTRFSSVNLLNGAVSMEKDSVGLAVQAGADIKLSKSMYLNLDVKKIKIESDLSAGGTKLATLKIDPWLAGIGIGWRF